MATKKQVSGKAALVQVLAKNGGPMAAKELVAEALKIATALKGKTPAATLSAMLATENAKKDGMFIRTKPGHYKLRSGATDKPRLAQRRKPAEKTPAAERTSATQT